MPMFQAYGVPSLTTSTASAGQVQKPFGGHIITPEARAKGSEAQRTSTSGPRFSAKLTAQLKRKANLDVIRGLFSVKEWAVMDSILGVKLNEVDPGSGELPHCTLLDVVVARITMRAMKDDKALSIVMDRVDGKAVQEVRSEGHVNIAFTIPAQMKKMIDDADRKAAARELTVDAEFEKAE